MELGYCRVCMTQSQNMKSFKVVVTIDVSADALNPAQTKLSLLEIFCDCTSIDTKLDAFSQEICLKCYDRLMEAYKFRREALDTDSRLKKNLPIKCEIQEELVLKEELFDEYVPEDAIKEEDSDSSYVNETTDEVNQEVTENRIKRIRKKFYACAGCSQVFKKRRELLMHMTEKKSQLDHQYHCLHCGKYFERKNSIQVHMVQHRVIDNGFKCDLCDKTYSQVGSLNNHKKVHHAPDPDQIPKHICNWCGKLFTTKSTLSSHIRLTHIRALKAQCHICQKQFVNNDRLKQHFSVHSDVRRFQCEQCPKSFKTRGSLELHKASVHVQERNFSCEICQQKFKTGSSLQKHKKIHADSFSFICHVCGAGFRSQLDLTDHANLHTGERPYKCEHCNKDFRYRRAYTDHMKLHTGRAITCEYCKKEFVRSRALKVHMQTHGFGVRDKICTFNNCGKGFFQNSDLRRHVDEVHLGLRKPKPPK